MKKVLILGIDGYLGWSLALRLMANGHRVHGCDNLLRRELVHGVGSASATPGSPDVEVCELGLLAEHWRTVAMHEIESNSDPYYWHIFRSPITWRPNALDKVIQLVASDRIWNVMVLDPADSWLLHPYDGGMDVILGSTGERDKLSNSFASWRSSRSDGL